MRHFKKLVTVCALPILFVSSSWANGENDLTAAYALYKKGAYPQAISVLAKVKGDQKKQALVAYWTGLCQSRLQSFDKAVVSFTQAQRLSAIAEDLDYELGQALYASQEPKRARVAFTRSAAARYKSDASTYYIGLTSQALEDYTAALKAYRSIQGMKAAEDGIKQAALLQIAEVNLLRAEAVAKAKNQPDLKTNIRESVLPDFEATVKFKSGTPAAQQAQLRMNELRRRIGDQPLLTARRPWLAKISQDLKYDTNVITQADQALTNVSGKSSLLEKTDAYAKFDFNVGRGWTLAPEVDFNYTRHFNREVPLVFQNDNITATPALRTRMEHAVSGNPAMMSLDVEFNFMLRDFRQNHTLPFYSRYLNFSLGERIKFLNYGNTSLSANVKFYENTDDAQNAINPGLLLTQNVKVNRALGFMLSLSGDYNRARSAFWDKVNYRAGVSVVAPDLLFGIDGSAGFDFTFVDTCEQRATRGWEKMLSPSLTLSKTFWGHAFIVGNYVYTKNTSLDLRNYAYSKQVMGISMGYRF